MFPLLGIWDNITFFILWILISSVLASGFLVTLVSLTLQITTWNSLGCRSRGYLDLTPRDFVLVNWLIPQTTFTCSEQPQLFQRQFLELLVGFHLGQNPKKKKNSLVSELSNYHCLFSSITVLSCPPYWVEDDPSRIIFFLPPILNLSNIKLMSLHHYISGYDVSPGDLESWLISRLQRLVAQFHT